MNTLFDNVNLASFGLENDGTVIDQNVSIDGGGGTAQYFTRDELIKHVSDNGLINEDGTLSEQGRTYLLNDQSFLDSYTTPEMQDTFFASFGRTPENTPSIENVNADQWHLDFKKILEGADQNSGKSSDNVPATPTTDKGEAEPVHNDANSSQEPSDPDKGEVAPTDPIPSLESYLANHISLEDPTVPLNGDGSVPSNINTQMAVMPVNDPTKPKTLEELYSDMDLEAAPSVTDDSENSLSVDEAVTLNTQTNGILASTGFDLSTATEDLSNGDSPYVTAQIDALQELNNKLREREDQSQLIINKLIETGGVDRETAEQLEKLKKGIITTNYSLEAFGTYPTLMGYKESLEASDAIKFGAAAAGAAVVFGILIKIVMWIRDKIAGAKRVTEKNRDAVRKITERLNSELIRIERDYSNDLSQNDKFKQQYIDMAKSYKLRAQYGSTSLLEVNDGIRTFVVHKNLRPKFNPLMLMMIEGDKVQQVTRNLIDAIQSIVPAIETNVNKLSSEFSGNGKLNVDSYKLDFKFVGDLEKAVNITSNGTDIERVTYFNDKFRQLLQPANSAAMPTFNKLIEFKFDLNGAYAFDDKYSKSLKNMLTNIEKMHRQAQALTDKDQSDNRIQIIELLRSQLKTMMNLTSNLIATRESAGTLLKGTAGATKEAIKAWTDLFKGTGITFNVQ